MGEGEPPSEKDTEEIRSRIKNHMRENGQDQFDPRDVQRLLTDNYYVHRFYMHVFELSGDQMENAIQFIINCFKRRKESGVADLCDSDLNTELKEIGAVFIHGRDKDGCPLLVFKGRNHQKRKEWVSDQKNLFLYLTERLEKEEPNKQMTVVFDCAGSGIKNLDMDNMQFMINSFKEDYPWCLNYILVYEMPWIMNAAFKIIKSWLPEAGVRKIKTVNKQTVGDYVQEESRPVEWGGPDKWEFEWVPGQFDGVKMPPTLFKTVPTPMVSAASTPIAAIEVAPRAAAPFPMASAPPGSPPPDFSDLAPSLSTQSSLRVPSSDGPPMPLLVQLSPHEEVSFEPSSGGGELVARISVKNIAGRPIAYKVKTTSPEKYKVKPSLSNLSAGGANTVEITVQSAHAASLTAASIARDKFLVAVFVVDSDSLSYDEIVALTKRTKPAAQHRLRCRLSTSDSSPLATPDQQPPAPLGGWVAPVHMGNGFATQVGSAPVMSQQQQSKQIDTIAKKVTSLASANAEMKGELATLRFFMTIVLAVVSVLLVVVLWRTHNLGSVCDSAGRTILADTVASPESIKEL